MFRSKPFIFHLNSSMEKENLDSLLKKVMVNRDLKDAKHSQGLWVSLQLVEGDLKQVFIIN